MKALKTAVSLVLVLCTAFAFAACAPQTSTEPSASESASSAASESAGASESAAPSESAAAGTEGNVLTLGTNATFAPYEYYEGDEIVGIDADIAKLIADKLGMTLKIEDMEFNSIIPAVQSGKVDIGMAGMTVNDERLQAVNFSTSYATGKQVIIVREDSDIKSADDFKGKTIGAQLATTGDYYVTWDYVDTGLAQIERYSKGADAIQALAQGKIDAVVIDNEPAKVFVAQTKGLKILETEYALEDYAIAISKDNNDLLQKIDGALQELIASGEVQKIIDKYIKAE